MSQSNHARQSRQQTFETSFQSEMYHIQQSLGTGETQASRVIHSHSMETFGSRLNTILLRPLSLFLGGFFALITASFITFIAASDGFAVNYSVVIISFVTGWLIGNLAYLFDF